MAYTPDAGDIAWIEFSPQSGRETKDRHPAVVLTPSEYSVATGLALVVPMTTKAKGGPFEVAMRGTKKARGVALANELRSIDYIERNAHRYDTCPPETLERIREIAETLVRGE